jgi:outer membrane protein OmpA-like peptidoglycan-associated protein
MAQSRIKTGPLLTVIGAVAAIFGLRYAYNNGYMGPATAGSAVVPQVAALPDAPPEAQPVAAAVPQLPLPSKTVAAVSGPEVRLLGMAWNAQLSLALAVGGPRTTSGSLMEKHGVNFNFIREDDCGKMQTQLIAFAKSLKGGTPQPTEGANFTAVMGDGSAAFIAGMTDELSKLGPDYMPEVVGSSGYSRGEDKLMGPAAWKANPKLMRGGLISGYLRDGDWNIAQKFASDNGIKNNPDEKTWDAEAINWFAADDFLKAAEAYINGVCEDRPVVHNGKRTGETKHICVQSVVTWTPGDVNIAKGNGGLVSIVSTKEYRNQMPMTIIGIKKWNQDNRKIVESWLSAMYEAGDQVKAYPAALHRGAEAEAEIYKDQDAAYWERYFRGVVEADKTGVQVDLGGSSANNLQDAARLYGLTPGSPNIFAATYTTFGDVVKQQYPKLVPSYPPVGEILNTSYTANIVKATTAPMGSADKPVQLVATEIKEVLGNRKYDINFDTGRATFTADSQAQLDALKNGILISEGQGIEIEGHTDNTGDPAKNLTLSQARADAVKAWLVTGGVDKDLFLKVKGWGDTVPAATNDTDTGRAKNRRVMVKLGH